MTKFKGLLESQVLMYDVNVYVLGPIIIFAIFSNFPFHKDSWVKLCCRELVSIPWKHILKPWRGHVERLTWVMRVCVCTLGDTPTGMKLLSEILLRRHPCWQVTLHCNFQLLKILNISASAEGPTNMRHERDAVASNGKWWVAEDPLCVPGSTQADRQPA